MVFAGLPFLYFFLPFALLLTAIVPRRARNAVLLLLSLFFYFYGEPKYVVLMVLTVAAAWGFGLWAKALEGKRFHKLPLVLSAVLSLFMLFYFKYTDFFISNINAAFGTSIALLRVTLPIGISFYTFQSISYVADVVSGRVKAEKNPVRFAAYLTFFPQLIAGPIVRYSDVEASLIKGRITLSGFSDGALRFCIGLGKKVLIANILSELVADFSAAGEKTVLFYWLYAVANALSIYFDFSGYSDMAIGLGKIFGFTFPENFRYPFTARSIADFWRRWHITLGSWFRDYVYIPLGGSRCSVLKQLRNILVVWAFTGLWHGASWNFVVWGLYFAAFLILERFFLAKYLERIPRVFSHLYVILVTLISFVIFSAGTLPEAGQTLLGMFGFSGVPLVNTASLYALQSYGMVLLLALFGSAPLLLLLVQKLQAKPLGLKTCAVLQPVAVAGLLVLSTAFLVAGSFNPFLYFRF